MHITNRLLLSSLILSGCVSAILYSSHVWLSALLAALLYCFLLAIAIEWLLVFLPPKVIRQRTKYKLMQVDNYQSIVVPNECIKGKDVERLLSNPQMDSKAAGALRKFIHFWQAPATECHQEIMERSELHTEISAVTTRLLSKPVEEIRQLARQYVSEAMSREKRKPADWSVTRLRTLITPLVISFYYEFLFRKKCPSSMLSMFSASIADVLSATANVGRGNMAIRRKLLAHLRELVEAEGGYPHIFGEECTLTLDQKAKYLQGVWFHTAVAQVMRLSCNAVANLGRNEDSMAKIKANPDADNPHLDYVLTETLRLFPGVNSTNRVAMEDVSLGESIHVAQDTNVIFDIVSYHRSSYYEDANLFRPGRWETLKKREAQYMPFGAGRRRCPAERLTFILAKEIVLGIIQTLEIHIPFQRGLLFTEQGRRGIVRRAGGSTVTNDLCCIVRRQPVSALKLRTMQYWLGWYLAVDTIRRDIKQLLNTPQNAEDAFHDRWHDNAPERSPHATPS